MSYNDRIEVPCSDVFCNARAWYLYTLDPIISDFFLSHAPYSTTWRNLLYLSQIKDFAPMRVRAPVVECPRLWRTLKFAVAAARADPIGYVPGEGAGNSWLGWISETRDFVRGNGVFKQCSGAVSAALFFLPYPLAGLGNGKVGKRETKKRQSRHLSVLDWDWVLGLGIKWRTMFNHVGERKKNTMVVVMEREEWESKPSKIPGMGTKKFLNNLQWWGIGGFVGNQWFRDYLWD